MATRSSAQFRHRRSCRGAEGRGCCFCMARRGRLGETRAPTGGVSWPPVSLSSTWWPSPARPQSPVAKRGLGPPRRAASGCRPSRLRSSPRGRGKSASGAWLRRVSWEAASRGGRRRGRALEGWFSSRPPSLGGDGSFFFLRTQSGSREGEASSRARVWLLASKPPASFLRLSFPPNPSQLFPLFACLEQGHFYLPRNS